LYAQANVLNLTERAGENGLTGSFEDATNPIDYAPPENGVLKFFTTLDRSLMEELQETFPKFETLEKL